MPFSYQNSMPRERLHAIVTRYFVPADQELVVQRVCDTVFHNPVDFCAVYIDHFKAALYLSLFSFLVDILVYYELALSQLVSNAVRTLIAFPTFFMLI